MEEALAKELVTPLGALPEALFKEYGSQETREAVFVHLCDKLQLGVHLLRLERAGGGDLGQFHGVLESLDCTDFAPCSELRSALLEELSHDRLAEHRGRSQ
jgi:5'-deoxynucleotidase YfbR-like HD superfamily hydrolase